MSRIGKLPIEIPAGVKVTVGEENIVTVTGPLGELKQNVNPDIKITMDSSNLIISRPSESKEHKSLHGLYRSLINNMIIGVSKGFEIKQELVGVGYKAETTGQILRLSLGYSHDFVFELPPEINVQAITEKRSNPVITLKGTDKQLLGNIAAKIRSFRKPEPYKGKGIKFVGEQLRKKAGKSASV